MNRSAIDDLVGSIVCNWYGSAAQWNPPGRLDAHTCQSCPTAIVASVIDVAVWPHELMHDLTAALERAAAEIAASLESDPDHWPSADVAGDAQIRVRDSIVQHREDILDVLTQCVEPRLENWLHAELTRAMPV